MRWNDGISWSLKLISAPTDQPVTLAQFKAHSRINFDDDDDFIDEIIIPAAVSHVDGKDGWLQRALIDQTWEFAIDRFPCYQVDLPLPPLIEVLSVKYDDVSAAEQTLATNKYVVDTAKVPGRILPAPNTSWPNTNCFGASAVRIQFRAGYLDQGVSPAVANVPGAIKAGILMYAATLYENRETVVIGQPVFQLPWAAEQLLHPFRIYW